MRTWKKRWMIAGLALTTGLFAFFLAKLGSRKEPVYKGRTATAWIKSYSRTAPPPPPTSTAGSILFSANIQGFVRVITPDGIVVSQVLSNGTLISSGVTGTFLKLPMGPVNLAQPTGATPGTPIGRFRSPLPVNSCMRGPIDASTIAMLDMGAPALPYLAKALQRTDTWMSTLYDKVWQKCPPTWQTNYLTPPFPPLELRRHAACILADLGQKAEPAVPELIRAVNDSDFEVRMAAIEALGGVGPGARAAVPILIAALKDPNTRVTHESFVALDRIGMQSATLEKAVDLWLRTRAADMEISDFLEYRQLHGPETVRILGRLLSVRTDYRRQKILYQIEAIGANAATILPQVLELLDDPELETRYMAVRAIGAMGPRARAALPRLKNLTEADLPRYPHAAERAIRKVNGEE